MRSISFVTIVIAIACSLSLASGVEITAQWDYPLDEQAKIDGFRLFYGRRSNAAIPKPDVCTAPAPYGHIVEVPDPAARSHTFEVPIDDPFHVAIVATMAARCSPFSNEVRVEPQVVIGPPVLRIITKDNLTIIIKKP